MIKIDDDGQVQIDGKSVGWLAREHVDVVAVSAEIDRLTARLQTAERVANEWRERAEAKALTLRERVAEALLDCPACGGTDDLPEEYPATLADLAALAVSHGVNAEGLCEVEASAMARATPDETHG